MTLNQAIEAALLNSRRNECTLHVNAVVRIRSTGDIEYELKGITYYTSDWYSSDATVYSATNGRGEPA